MIYIQRKDHRTKQLETVDEFDDLKVARYTLAEYRLSDRSAAYYLSQRACQDWRC